MSSKKQQAKAQKLQAEEDKLKQAILDHPYKPSKIKDLGTFYQENSLVESGEAANKLKRQAYDTFIRCIAKHDELKFAKDKNGASIKLDKREINTKCSLLVRLAQMSKDMDIIKTPSTLEDNEAEARLDPEMQSQVNQLYFYLRSELSQREEVNDAMMASRYKSEVETLKQKFSAEAIERGNTKFTNFLEDEGMTALNDHAASLNGVKTIQHSENNNNIQRADKVGTLQQMDAKKEAELVKDMIKNMSKRVEVDSVWYIVSMSWINRWQNHVGFDKEEGDAEPLGPSPGKMDNQDIIEPNFIGSNGQITSTILTDFDKKFMFTNAQMKKHMKEGDDYMLVDENIFNFWDLKYGQLNEIKRFGIEDENGENVVEIYLKVFNLYLIPNEKYFKMQGMREKGKFMKGVAAQNTLCPTIPIYISRSARVKQLQIKVCRVLTAYIYMKMADRTTTVKQVRLWKSNYMDEEAEAKLKEVDQKFSNYTHVKIDADILNKSEEQQEVALHDLSIGDTDILVVELPKSNGDFVFQPLSAAEDDEDFADPLNKIQGLQNGNFDLMDLDGLRLEQLFKKSSARGLCGLQNLGNTCFMNSGLQCISNTLELTKFFLFDVYKKDINEDNPLGLGGKLADAFQELLTEMWLDKSGRTAPHQLKRVLGKRVARFSGYGQQDSCELINYFLDLIHEDLNRVKKKPYVELPDHDGTKPDKEMSPIFWQAFLARNQSIITDLMYGQLKSTVKCTVCGNISIAFDPYLTLPLPICRPSYFKVFMVPYDIFRQSTASQSDEEDEDYITSSDVRVDHPNLNLEINANSTVFDLKKEVISVYAKLDKNKRQFSPENLQLCISSSGEIDATFDDDDIVDKIDTGSYGSKIHFIEVRKERVADLEDIKSTEINFSKFTINKRSGINQQIITGGIPRFVDFHMDDTPIEMKKKVYKVIEGVFKKNERAPSEQESPEKFEEWINTNINLQIKDNTPYEKTNTGYSYTTRKVVSEFSGRRHNNRDDICDIAIEGFPDGNDLEKGGRDIKLRDLYGMLKYKRNIRFEVMINKDSGFDVKGLTLNRDFTGESQKGHMQVVQLDSCFKQFQAEELLTGDDQWYCNKCKEHRDAFKKLDLYMTPKILMIQLKRFTQKKSNNSSRSGFFNMAYAQICNTEKVNEPVDFPIEGLDVSEYVKMDCDANGVSTMYDLYGIVNHFGNLNGGHYTATIKSPLDDQWYYYNDSSVSQASKQKIMNDAAYVLFYRRRDAPAKMEKTQASETTQSTTIDQQSKAGQEEEKQADPNDDEFLNELDP